MIIIHPRSIICPFQPVAITKLFPLLFLPAVLVFVFRLPERQCFTTYPRHRQPKRIVMRFLKDGPADMGYRQIIKEHPD